MLGIKLDACLESGRMHAWSQERGVPIEAEGVPVKADACLSKPMHVCQSQCMPVERESAGLGEDVRYGKENRVRTMEEESK